MRSNHHHACSSRACPQAPFTATPRATPNCLDSGASVVNRRQQPSRILHLQHRLFRAQAIPTQLQKDRSISNDAQAADPRLAAGPAAGSHGSPCSARCEPACTMHHAPCKASVAHCTNTFVQRYTYPSATGAKHPFAMLLTIAIPDPCHACASCMGCSGRAAGCMCLPAHGQLDLPGPQ